MDSKGLMSDVERVRRVFPNANLDLSGGWITIPHYPLPSRYNRGSTRVLFRLFLGSPYHEPYIYVPTDLNLAYLSSHHLDFCTEPEMKNKGWKRICAKMNWKPEYCLLDAVHLAMDFLNNLRD